MPADRHFVKLNSKDGCAAAHPTRAGKRFSRGETLRGYRAPCPHYPRCIGCPLIDLPYPEQLKRKHAMIAQIFRRYPSLSEISIPSMAPSPRRLGYRARVKLVVRAIRGKIAAGLYVPGSHRVVEISRCPVHPQPVNDVLRYLIAKLQEFDIRPYDERDDSGELRHIDFRFSFARREINVTLVTRHRLFPQGVRLARALQRRFSFVSGVVQNVNEQRGNAIWGNSYRTLGGSETILDRIGGLKMVFPAGVFSQANPFTSAKVYEKIAALAELAGTETVLDLYSGVGPVALTLARNAAMVWGIEDSQAAVAAAKQNARRNGIANCRFVVGDVAAAIAAANGGSKAYDLVITNPPRKGLQPAAMEAMLAVSAPRIIYASCEPVSLARDLDTLTQSGYRITSVHPFDMFPQTMEVETVALLEKT